MSEKSRPLMLSFSMALFVSAPRVVEIDRVDQLLQQLANCLLRVVLGTQRTCNALAVEVVVVAAVFEQQDQQARFGLQ